MKLKFSERPLPNYSKGEEIFNMVSHIVGGALGIVALVLTIVISVKHGNGYGLAGSIVYGISLILLYTTSSIYHGLTHPLAKRVFRVLDHCMIYLLIAGTYTPIVLSGIRSVSPVMAWIMFGVIWGLAALAITLTAIDMKKFEIFSLILYVIMGWWIVFFSKVVIAALSLNGFLLLLTGGIFYTIGAILYGIGKKKKYMHCAFHVFVLIGSIFHFLSIFLYSL